MPISWISLLEWFEQGKSIITPHHKPITQLTPAPQTTDALLQLEGARWNGKKPTGGQNRPKITGKTIAEYVIEDRR